MQFQSQFDIEEQCFYWHARLCVYVHLRALSQLSFTHIGINRKQPTVFIHFFSFALARLTLYINGIFVFFYNFASPHRSDGERGAWCVTHNKEKMKRFLQLNSLTDDRMRWREELLKSCLWKLNLLVELNCLRNLSINLRLILKVFHFPCCSEISNSIHDF